MDGERYLRTCLCMRRSKEPQFEHEASLEGDEQKERKRVEEERADEEEEGEPVWRHKAPCFSASWLESSSARILR